MEIWTTFAPSKVNWELTTITRNGRGGSGDWVKNLNEIKNSINTLKAYGIKGIRLAIFPTEITKDGEEFNWQNVDLLLDYCNKIKLKVEWPLGPFQYPYDPGIRLPVKLLNHVTEGFTYLDHDPDLNLYGENFIKLQLDKFKSDKRIASFSLSNEWPDFHKVEGLPGLKAGVSREFMIEALKIIKQSTKKKVSLNTNISIDNPRKISNTFGELLDIIGETGILGLDIYPFRESWRRIPFIKLRRLIIPYRKRLIGLINRMKPIEVNFAEIEAQPWGSGQSWFTMIKESQNAEERIGTYIKGQLEKTYKKYLKDTGIKKASLWGADFWLSSEKMGISWPIEDVKKMSELDTY